jgi:two-component system, OmpR family, KDP operon response regulator KdpE
VSSPRVLVIDDEPQIRRALRAVLAGNGYQVLLAASGEEGLNLGAERSPDLVILDLMLPDISGLEVCRELRAWSQVPILVLSARGQEEDKVAALDLGADDYLTKPFGTNELLARLRAALRRRPGEAPPAIMTSGDLRLDQARRQVTLGGRELRLTPTEYEMLRYLMANAGKVVTHRALLREVWGSGYEDAGRTLRVFISQLRRKIEPTASSPRYIRTEPTVGYRFIDER